MFDTAKSYTYISIFPKKHSKSIGQICGTKRIKGIKIQNHSL